MAELLSLEFRSSGPLKKRYTDIINFVLDPDWPTLYIPKRSPAYTARVIFVGNGGAAMVLAYSVCLPSIRHHESKQRPREAEAVEAKKLMYGEIEVSVMVPFGLLWSYSLLHSASTIAIFCLTGHKFLASTAFASLASCSSSWSLRIRKAPRWSMPRPSSLPFIRCYSRLLWVEVRFLLGMHRADKS